MKVRVTDEAYDQIEKLPLTIQGRVRRVVYRLQEWPDVSGVKWLTGPWKGLARIRTGDYRVIFRLANPQLIEVVRVSDRRDAYTD
jgi:mRNA-degrading endonuclease RelE of RelBE toxin-antitoxin system